MHRSQSFAAALITAASLVACGKKEGSKGSKGSKPTEPSRSIESGQLDAERAELERQRAEREQQLAQQRDELIAQLDGARRELEALRAGAASDAQIAAKQREIDALKVQVAGKHKQVEELKVTAATITTPIAGLWQSDTSRQLGTGKGCRLLVEITALAYKKALVCDEGDESVLKLSVETGSISAVTEEFAGAPNALNATLTVRRLVTKPAKSSCAAGYLATTTTLEWRPTMKDALSVVSGDVRVKGLLRDDAGLEAATCDQILSRPERSGLEKAVAACTVFAAADEQISARPDVGCFADNDPLTWAVSPYAAVGQTL